MAQSTTLRGSCWLITDYNVDDHEARYFPKTPEDTGRVPDWVKECHGGVEICPDTQRRHLQVGIVCSRQIRLSALISWVPGAHCEVAKNRTAVLRYAMKEETAEGEKQVATNSTPFLAPNEILDEISDYVVAQDGFVCQSEYSKRTKAQKEAAYMEATCDIVAANPRKLATYMNPRIKTMWLDYGHVFVLHAIQRVCQNGAFDTDEDNEEERGGSD